jgi:hypothetical protein
MRMATVPLDPAALRRRHDEARRLRAPLEPLWRDCADLVLPARQAPGQDARVYDGTAPDAAEQLAASLLAELTPPWSRWCAVMPGPDVPPQARGELALLLDRASEALHAAFDASTFAVEVHQCYLDLVVFGTASLLVEDAPLGEAAPFRCAAVPVRDLAVEEGPDGRLDGTFRRSEPSAAQLAHRFPQAIWPRAVQEALAKEPQRRFPLIEAVLPHEDGFGYAALLEQAEGGDGFIVEGRLAHSPFLNFRWLKTPGEAWGRSPAMKALPDIRTANKVVELVLKNASIAVTGIWQAEDDGVLNPATVRLVPGAIIPKAPGSAGLTPLAAPGRFDLSQMVLEDLRTRIRHALLVDRLGQIDSPRMSATEVLERGAEMTRQLGAVFGRLRGELLEPLVQRVWTILRRRGLVPDLPLDGRVVVLRHLSPLARAQAQANVQPTLLWLERAAQLGPEGLACIDIAATTRWLAKTLGVPGELVHEAGEPPAL